MKKSPLILLGCLFLATFFLSFTSLQKKKEKSLQVSAYLIYRSGKLSSFDVLNDKSISLWNTIIGEGAAEDWSNQTKIVLTGSAKNVSLVVSNGGKIVLNKKGLNVANKAEFIIKNTGCQELIVKVKSEDTNYIGKVPFNCGE
ncbi:MAG: hypothetical protein SFU27_02880 [Thermonemataceae bacterium]|nr:hypothetical protein [Thermonemataceae bacterium]